MDSLQSFLFILQIILSIFIILFVLLQQSDEDSLSGIGAGASQKMLSKRNLETPISKATFILIILFMLNSIMLATISARNVTRINELEKYIQEQKENESSKVILDNTNLLKK